MRHRACGGEGGVSSSSSSSSSSSRPIASAPPRYAAAAAASMYAGPHSPEIEIVHRSLHIAHVDVEGEQVDLLPSVRQSLRPVSLRQSVLCLRTGASVLRDNTSKRFGSRSRAAASGVGARSSPSMMPSSSSSPPSSIGSVC